jgi:hypothetical protein
MSLLRPIHFYHSRADLIWPVGPFKPLSIFVFDYLHPCSLCDGILQFSVADPGCLSRIPDPNFFHPGSEFFPSRTLIKEFKYFTPKICFYALGNMIRVVHPGSGS